MLVNDMGTLPLFVEQQPNSSLGSLIFEVSRSHTWYDSSERMISSSQRPLPTEHTTNARDEYPCSRRDSTSRSQQSSGSRPTPQIARQPGSAWETLQILTIFT